MICNKITIPEFTKEQIAECQTCKHASAKKIWCCRFGVSIQEKSKIIIPRNYTKYNKGRFQRNYLVAIELCKEQVVIDEAVFVTRRQICATCPPEDKIGCGCAGCKQWHKLALKELKCPLDKWPKPS